MPRSVRECARPFSLAILWSLVALQPVGASEESRLANRARWLPGISFESGLLVQDSDGSAESADFGRQQDERLFLVPELRLGLELMTPAFESLPGQPRLFANAGLAVVFDGERNLVKEGNPPNLEIPDLGLDNMGMQIPTPTAIIRGTGQATRTELDPLVWSAGLGIAWEFELWERNLRVKPSLQYRYASVEVTALFSNAVALDGGDECPCRSARLEGSEDDGYHALGPGLEIEVDAARAESLLISVFGAAAAYHALGNEKTSVRVDGSYDDTPPTPASVTSVLDRDTWSYRVGVGLRVWWLPE